MRKKEREKRWGGGGEGAVSVLRDSSRAFSKVCQDITNRKYSEKITLISKQRTNERTAVTQHDINKEVRSANQNETSCTIIFCAY